MRRAAKVGLAVGMSASALTGCWGGEAERTVPPTTESTTSTTFNRNLPQASDAKCLAVRALNITVSGMEASDREVLDATVAAEATITTDPNTRTDIDSALRFVTMSGRTAAYARALDVSGNPQYMAQTMRGLAANMSAGFLINHCHEVFPDIVPGGPAPTTTNPA